MLRYRQILWSHFSHLLVMSHVPTKVISVRPMIRIHQTVHGAIRSTCGCIKYLLSSEILRDPLVASESEFYRIIERFHPPSENDFRQKNLAISICKPGSPGLFPPLPLLKMVVTTQLKKAKKSSGSFRSSLSLICSFAKAGTLGNIKYKTKIFVKGFLAGL
jgi:hypothetical protein